MWKHVKKNMWRSFEIGTDQRRPWRWILLKWRRPRCCDDWCGSGVGVEGGCKFEMVYRIYIYIYTYVFTLLDWFEPIHRKWASFVSGCFGRYCRSCWIMMDIYTYILYQYAKYVKIPKQTQAIQNLLFAVRLAVSKNIIRSDHLSGRHGEVPPAPPISNSAGDADRKSVV